MLKVGVWMFKYWSNYSNQVHKKILKLSINFLIHLTNLNFFKLRRVLIFNVFSSIESNQFILPIIRGDSFFRG